MVARFLVVCALIVGCRSDGDADRNDGGPRDAVATMTQAWGDGPGAHRYRIGVYKCCAEGEDTGCCTTEELARGLCFPSRPCHGRGQLLSAKTICSRCCDGLTAVAYTVPVRPPPDGDGPSCDFVGSPSARICLRCGDGVCDNDENSCRCSECR